MAEGELGPAQVSAEYPKPEVDGCSTAAAQWLSVALRGALPAGLLRHGWLPGLSPRNFGTPWAVVAGDLAIENFEKSPWCVPSTYWSDWYPDWDQRILRT